MIETEIVRLLQQAVTSAVNEKLPVKYLAVNFKKPSNDKFWEIVYIPNNISDEFWGSGKTYRGVMRLILHWPQNNKGAYESLEEVKRVAGYFQKGKEMYSKEGSFKIILTNEPDLTSFIEEESSLLLPLTIAYSCFKL